MPKYLPAARRSCRGKFCEYAFWIGEEGEGVGAGAHEARVLSAAGVIVINFGQKSIT